MNDMKQQYFTPDISDIRVGYECEEGSWDIKNDVRNWHPFVWKKDKPAEDLEGYTFRTPYLTKEQIEAEGWKYMDKYTIEGSSELRCVFQKNNHWLSAFFKEGVPTINIIPINPVKSEFFEQVRYVGGCKSINEFRTIIKLLNIG
jgi:hypothetical protein